MVAHRRAHHQPHDIEEDAPVAPDTPRQQVRRQLAGYAAEAAQISEDLSEQSARMRERAYDGDEDPRAGGQRRLDEIRVLSAHLRETMPPATPADVAYETAVSEAASDRAEARRIHRQEAGL
jgi:hypothetical protein